MKTKNTICLLTGLLLAAAMPASGMAAGAVSVETAQILGAGQMRVTLVDCDTGELLVTDAGRAPSMGTNISLETPEGTVSTGPVLMLDTNPSVHENIGSFLDADSFSMTLYPGSLPDGYVFPDNAEQVGYYSGTVIPEGGMTVTRYDNESADVVIRLQYVPTGDVGGDGDFGLVDVVLLQQWLLGIPGKELADWKAADFCRDNKLNVLDLCRMKQELIGKTAAALVEPDERTLYGNPMYVVEDGLGLYLGPDTSYPCVASIPKGTTIEELGYQKNAANWVFTEYDGQSGWIPIIREGDGEPTVVFMQTVDKPVIYLYPEEETDVHVELTLTQSELATTYPRYRNGWDVTARPDGSLLNKADGTHHRYLFWDSVNSRTLFDFSEGFCVAGSDTEDFLREKLTYMGLTEEERNEFIVYWLPRMEHHPYNLIAFQGDAYTESARLSITPEPDSLCRIFMAYVPLEDAVEVQPQTLTPFERQGFAVVEWGGCEIPCERTGN